MTLCSPMSFLKARISWASGVRKEEKSAEMRSSFLVGVEEKERRTNDVDIKNEDIQGPGSEAVDVARESREKEVVGEQRLSTTPRP